MTSFSIGGFGPASLVGKLTLNKGVRAIFATAFWRDNGVWIDNAVWRD